MVASRDDRAAEPWATIRVHPTTAPGLDATELLDTLGLLLVEHAEIGGVEHRDPGTLVGAPHPELWVYTTPPSLDGAQARIAVLAERLGLRVELTAEVHHDDDWRESWKQFYPPTVLGDGAVLLRPSWVERRPGDPEREVVLDPGRAFGTGLHQSTRLCLDRLCALWAEGLRPRTILDLGCGSGILALTAARLFPEARLRAVDMDPEAVETTRENVELNGLLERIELATGTVHSEGGPAVDLLIANIRPEVLIPGAPEIRERVAPGGRVLLSDILVEEAAEVREAYVRQGLEPEPAGARVMGEWESVELRSP